MAQKREYLQKTVLLLRYPARFGLAVLILILIGGAANPSAAQPKSPAQDSSALDIPVTVKENAGVAAGTYPVSVVIPLPQGQYTATAQLGMLDAPSQVEPLERWAGDNSLRSVLVHFQPDVTANGSAVYHFGSLGQIAPARPIVITETASTIDVFTGPVKFTLSKTSFRLLSEVWYDSSGSNSFEPGEQVITQTANSGGVLTPRPGAGAVQYDAGRTSLEIKIEEHGPMRAVIRIAAPTEFITTTQHTHGFAVRLYAYAGQPFIKVDYQLQNSDRLTARSWPLYFEALNLDYQLIMSQTVTAAVGLGDDNLFQQAIGPAAGMRLAQVMHNRFSIQNETNGNVLHDSGNLPNGSGPDGFLEVHDSRHGVMAVIRNFWQMWPNGLAVTSGGRLSFELFPAWSAQWYNGQFSSSGLYWLEDMQHVYKETLLAFHRFDRTDQQIIALARTFQFPPVAAAPVEWLRQTHAMLDLGGVIPPAETIPAFDDQRQPAYHGLGFNPADWFDPASSFYGAGWVNFYDPEPGYRSTSCTTGGWPYSASAFLVSGRPADYFTAEGWAIGELNLRPQWLSGYQFSQDWPLLQLSENPYCGGRWRVFSGHGISKLIIPPLADTGADTPVYFARDDQHGWVYHLAEGYWLTGNPWIRDWYEFLAEFRQARLQRLDPSPDRSSRATGHALNQVLQAYRITGKSQLLTAFGSHLRQYLRPEQDPVFGDQLPGVEPSGGGFQTGYLMRTIVDYLEEVRLKGDWQAYAEGFSYLTGLVQWNLRFGNFAYYFDARQGGRGISDGSGLTMVDPVAWYYAHSGRQAVLDHLNQYLQGGLNGGTPPYGQFSQWNGQFEGRYYLQVANTPRPDKTPPAAVKDLSIHVSGGQTALHWTAPAGAARYLIIWSRQPILPEDSSAVIGQIYWWAANPVAPDLAPVPGTQQTWIITTGSASPVYAVIFSFDSSENLSDISNLALAIPSGNYKLYLPGLRR